MATKHPMPVRCFRHHRFTHQRDWYLSDISIGLSGQIVVSGGHKKRRETFIDIYGRQELNQSQLPYSLHFDKISDDWRRFSSLFGATFDVLVTCSDDCLQQLKVKIEGQKYMVLKSGKLKGKANCLTVNGGQIFVGLFQVNQLYIYDENLTETKSIALGEFENGGWPYDVQIISERLFVCIAYGKALSFRESDATLLTEFDDPSPKDANSWSITGNEELDIVCIVWDRTRIVIYSLSKSTPFLTINVDEYSSKVRISDKGCFIIAKQKTGEVEMYSMRDLITYTQLKEVMVSTLHCDDCVKLMKHFNFPKHQLEAIRKSETPNEDLVLALEERAVLSSSNVENLRRTFTELSIESSCYEVAVLYKNTRSDPTLYENFLGTLSAHLTASIPGDLCDYFEICGEDRTKITSGQNPGLSLLSALNEMGVIRPSGVGALEKPFKHLGMIQAVAKIHEYQTLAKEEGERLLKPPAELSYEEKKNAFVQYLKKKIKHWYETTTPVPWKKSCKWKLSDLFIGSGLILTDAKSKKIPANIDESCKLNYTDIFSHERLESETRLVIAGEPGSGKTMLMAQLAYDWSEGKLSKVKKLVLIPLKLVGQATLAQAIKDFYIPHYSTLTTNDVRRMLLDKDTPIHLLLDGLEEYGSALPNLNHSEVMKVVSKDLYSECKVVITARSDFIQHLPDLPYIPTLRLGLFGEKERKMYIEKVFENNTHMQQKVLHFIQENSFILHLCSIPLTFALAVHNIEKLLRLTETNVCRVGPFMRGMIETLRYEQHSYFSVSEHHDEEIRGLSDALPYLDSSSDEESEDLGKDYYASQGARETFASQEVSYGLHSNVNVTFGEKELFSSLVVPTDFEHDNKSEQQNQTRFSSSIEELAFNGLCRGIQQLSWQKEFVERNVQNFKSWVDSGIFVIEEVSLANPKMTREAVKHHEHEQQSYGRVEGHINVAEEEKYQFFKRKDNDATKDGYYIHQDKSVELEESDLTTNEASEETLMQVPLQIKFLHKIIQEWFASKHLSSLLWRSISTSGLEQCLDKHIPFIPPDDLHYVIRFTCFLCQPSCHLIVKSLIKRYRCENRIVPEYVMNCIFLSFVECVEQPDDERKIDELDEDMKEALTQVCKEEITICANDTMFLQQAKVAVLTLASKAQIPMRKLRLNGVVVSSFNDLLGFDSGIKMGVMDTLQVIEISRWDHTIKEEDRADVINQIIRFTGKCRHLKTVQLHFPFNPPPPDEKTLTAIINTEVKWIIGGRLHQILDTNTGQWMVEDRQSLPARKSHAFSCLQQFHWFPSLETEATVTPDSTQIIAITGTKVELTMPCNALPEGMDKCKVKLRIVPRLDFEDPCKSFSSNSAVVVELLPNNVRLKFPATLRIPHCLMLQESAQHEVKIYMSHHEEGCKPHWEEQTHLSYKVEERSCILLLDRFCWVTITVGDRTVLGKRVIFYACGKPLDPQSQSADVAVGYYHNLDGEGEFLQHNSSIVSQKMPFTFLKEGARPLSLNVEKYSRDQWKLWPPEENIKVVPFEVIDSPFDYTWPLLFQRITMDSRGLMCAFKALQEQGQHPIELKICIETQSSSNLLPSRSPSADVHQQGLGSGDTGPDIEFPLQSRNSTASQNDAGLNVGTKHVTMQAEENLIHSFHGVDLGNSQQRILFNNPSSNCTDDRDLVARPKLPGQRETNDRGYDSKGDISIPYQHQSSHRNNMELHRQMATLSDHTMLLPTGFHTPGPSNISIQNNYYTQCLSMPQYGTQPGGVGNMYAMIGEGEGTQKRSFRYGILQAIAKKLDPIDALGHDWKQLADRLGFSMADLETFETIPGSSTVAVINCAVKSGKLQSLHQLKSILQGMERPDAAAVIPNEDLNG